MSGEQDVRRYKCISLRSWVYPVTQKILACDNIKFTWMFVAWTIGAKRAGEMLTYLLLIAPMNLHKLAFDVKMKRNWKRPKPTLKSNLELATSLVESEF
jgi:hypothetical protein